MTLREAIEQYILWRQAHGAKFTTASNLLRHFLRYADGDAECDAVSTAQVLAFLAGARQLTRNRENKYYTLAGFWRHAISRGHATRSPLPNSEPKSPPRTPPYIYSRDELRRLLDPVTVANSRRGAVQFDAVTFRTLLLLLYGAGLRFSEATGQFYKSRLVPIGPQLATALANYIPVRRRGRLAQDETSYFLANRDGTRLASSTVQAAFDRLRRMARVHSATGGRQIPRLHDLRHSFAVHSLTAWYRQGADVQRLLPVLSSYLGHSDLEGTKVYLSMTPELLRQASLRFARYAGGGENA
jgi:site-specific recombinase XerD